MTRITFPEVTIRRKATWVEDGKKRQRTEKFWATVNPWNVDENGLPKTREQVFASILAKADAWTLEMQAEGKTVVPA